MLTQLVFLIFLIIVLPTSAHLCGKQDVSCAHCLWEHNMEVDIPDNACLLKYYPLDSLQCHSLQFTENVNLEIDLGHIDLFARVTECYRQSLFKIVLKNIAWKHAKIKFSRIGMEKEKNMCRNFDIWGNLTLPENSSLVYDCSWSLSDFEGHDYSFEYELGLPWNYHKYIFKVPIYEHFANWTLVENLEVFSYLEVSNPEYVALYIQPSKLVYNITKYAVEEFLEQNNHTTLIGEVILESNELIYTFPTSDKFGFYYFSVRPISSICPNSECKRTFTPKVFIERYFDYLFFIICTGVIVVMFSLCLVWTCKRRQKGRKCNQILLVYNPKSKSHFKVVYRLAVVFRDVLNLKVLFDELDIPRTTHKDPFIWCPEAFDRATDIIYISSPSSGNFKKNTRSVYKIEGIVQKYIKSELVKRDSKKQILVATFPYSRDLVPLEFRNLKTFNLMNDVNRLLSALGLSSYKYLSFANLLKRSKLQNDERYQKLIKSVQRAEEEFRSLEEVIKEEEMPLVDVAIAEELMMINGDVLKRNQKDEKCEVESRTLIASDFANRLSNLDLSGRLSSEKYIPGHVEGAAKPFVNNINDLSL